MMIRHLSPFVFYTLLVFLLGSGMQYEIRASHGRLLFHDSTPKLIQYYYAIPLAISGLYYCIVDLFKLRQQRQKIANLFITVWIYFPSKENSAYKDISLLF